MNESKSRLNRRNFLASAGILGFSGLLPTPLWATEIVSQEDKTQVLKAGPYIQSKGKGKMTIRWITNLPCYSWIEYGKHADQTDQKADSVSEGLADAYQTIHAITLKDLSPGETYYYRINSKVIEKFDPYNVVFGETYTSPVFSFTPINKHTEKISFLVFNDIHDRPESFSNLLQFQTPGKKDFILLNGDIFSHMNDEDQIVEHLFEPFSNVFPETPLVFARGNHETRGNLPEIFMITLTGKTKVFIIHLWPDQPIASCLIRVKIKPMTPGNTLAW